MSVLSDDTSLIAGAVISSSYAGHGILGSAVPSAGTNGPSMIYPAISLPADASSELRALITRYPSGTLDEDEDGTFVYSGANDYLEFVLYADGVAVANDAGWGAGVTRVWLYTSFTAVVSNAQAGDDLPSGAFACSPPSIISSGVIAAPDSPAGAFAAAPPSIISSGVQAADDIPVGTLAGFIASPPGSFGFSLRSGSVRFTLKG